MSKKIITVLLLITLVLVGKVESATLTQKLGNEYIETTVEKDETVRMIFTSKEGFRFKNWVLIEGNINISLSNNDITFSMPDENVTIEAEYDTSYLITFNSNDGTGTTTSMSITAGATEKLIANTFIREGYMFEGWSESVNGVVIYDDEDDCTPSKNLTLYAVWEINQVTVQFESNGGSTVSNITVTYGSAYGTLPTTSKIGYTFSGWYEETGLTNQIISTTEVRTTSTHTLYAKWTANTYTVVYNANDGTGSMSNSTHIYNISSNLTTNAFTKTGYTFAGWARTASGGVAYTDGQSISKLTSKANGTVNLYAVWLASDIRYIPVGAYIEYNPAYSDTATGQAVTSAVVLGSDAGTADNQIFYFSDYEDGWKVLYNDNGLITLISAESIGDLTLGTDTSTFINEYDTSLNASKTAYAKCIYTLNKLCNEWGKGALAAEGRSVGYGGDYPGPDNLFDEGITLNDITHEKLREKIDGGILNSPYRPYVSTYLLAERSLIIDTQDASGKFILRCNAPYVWLPFRHLTTSETYTHFNVMALSDSGNLLSNGLYVFNTNGVKRGRANTNGVRPIITLKSGLNLVKTEGKDGTSVSSAYVLN